MIRFRLSRLAYVAVLFALGACQAAVPPTASTVLPALTAAPTTAIALYSCPRRTLTWDGASAIDLTGTWAGDDQGVYYVRQLGDQVWWLGMSGVGRSVVDRGSDWTNVYFGKLSGNTVTGTYADVPGGKIQDNGPVVMKLTPTSDGGIKLVRTDPLLATGFGGTLLTPCKIG